MRDQVLGVTRAVVFESPCEDGPAGPPSCAVIFRAGERADLEALTLETHDYGESAKRFGRERLERGDSLFIGESGGAVLFYAWLMYGQIDFDENILVPLAPGIAYSYRVFTVPQARNTGLCRAYYAYIRRHLLEQGYTRLLTRIHIANLPSIRAHLRAGFVERGAIWRLVTPARTLYYADSSLRSWLPAAVPEGPFGRNGLLAKHAGHVE
jgi:RimJ/RimL family protein N-acetyltransferase